MGFRRTYMLANVLAVHKFNAYPRAAGRRMLKSVVKNILFLMIFLLGVWIMIRGEDHSLQVMKLAASMLFLDTCFSAPRSFDILKQNGLYLPYMQAAGREAISFACWMTIMDWSLSATAEHSIMTILFILAVWLTINSIWFFVHRASKG